MLAWTLITVSVPADETCSGEPAELEASLLTISKTLGLFTDLSAIKIAGDLSSKAYDRVDQIDKICGYISDGNKGIFESINFLLGLTPDNLLKSIITPYLTVGESFEKSIKRLTKYYDNKKITWTPGKIGKVYLKIVKEGRCCFFIPLGNNDVDPKEYARFFKKLEILAVDTQYPGGCTDETSNCQYVWEYKTVQISQNKSGYIEFPLGLKLDDKGVDNNYNIFVKLYFTNGKILLLPVKKPFLNLENDDSTGYRDLLIELKTEKEISENNLDSLQLLKQ